MAYGRSCGVLWSSGSLTYFSGGDEIPGSLLPAENAHRPCHRRMIVRGATRVEPHLKSSSTPSSRGCWLCAFPAFWWVIGAAKMPYNIA